MAKDKPQPQAGPELAEYVTTAKPKAYACLLYTSRMSASVHSVILSPVQQHSRKPAETRDRIVELMGDLPRIELFAREAAPGWDAWGNEAPTPGARKEETNGQNDPGDPAPEL